MAYTLDPDVAAALAVLAEAGSSTPPVRGDWQALRDRGNAGQAYFASITPHVSGVSIVTHSTVSADGAPIELRWYNRGESSRAPPLCTLTAEGWCSGASTPTTHSSPGTWP